MRLLERKRPWVEHAHYKSLVIEARNQSNALATRLNEIADIGAPQEQEIMQEQTQIDRQQTKRKTIAEKIRDLQIQLNSRTEDLEAFDDDIYRYRKDIKNLNKRYQEREEGISNLRLQIKELEGSLEDLSNLSTDRLETKLVGNSVRTML